MAVESAAPSNARQVYTLLLALGVVAAIVSSVVIGVISYNYVTRVELREPAGVESTKGEAAEAAH
ncbi:MAG: hypothetical protein VW450_08390 [Chloroflexota bacterium]